MIACVSPERTVRSTPLRISVTSSSWPTVTCRSRMSRVLIRSRPPVGVKPSRASMVVMMRSCEFGDADPLDDVGEEAAHDEAAGLVLGDAARLQVEQLQVVEAAGGAGVSGAGDVAGLDLQVGHRVGPRAVGQQQVAVHLVGLRAGRRRDGCGRRRSRPCGRCRRAARSCRARRSCTAAARGRRTAASRCAARRRRN